MNTYALLDSGSNVSLCHEKLLSLLKTQGRREKMRLTTVEKADSESSARIASLQVFSADGEECIDIPKVYSRPQLNLNSVNLVTEEEVQKWPHLKDLPIRHAEATEVTILIGQDCPEALIPISTVAGKRGEPYATRTRLGWTVSGPVSRQPS